MYGENPEKTIIVNIDIVNNEKLCLEKFHKNNEVSCEFPDNNQCFIIIIFDKLENPVLNEDIKLISKNLIKWNNNNYNESIYNYCKNNFLFHIFSISYFNFTYETLNYFKDEFPLSEEKIINYI